MTPETSPPRLHLAPGDPAAVAELRRLWKRMQLVRRFEEHIIHQYDYQNGLFAQKQVPPWTIKCPTHLSIGQEATAVGACAPLGDADVVFSTHRCHAHYIAKGGDVGRGLAEMYGRSTGCGQGKGGSMHLVDPSVGMMGASAIVGGSIPLAVGAALAAQLRGQSLVSMAFFGDGATEQGVFSESLGFAALRRLPLVLFCENNGYATLSHITTRQDVPISQRGAGFGVPSIDVDGNDVLAVRDAMRVATDRARAGEGPTLIVGTTYRWYAHVGTEPDTGNMRRSQAELEAWKARCPVANARAALLRAGVAEAELAADEAEIEATMSAGIAFARSSPEPVAADLYTSV